MSDFIALNTDEVSAGINQLSAILAEIDARNGKCIALLQQHADAAKGKNRVINTLVERISAEVTNIKGLVETVEEIGAEADRYAEKLAEADDDSALQI